MKWTVLLLLTTGMLLETNCTAQTLKEYDVFLMKDFEQLTHAVNEQNQTLQLPIEDYESLNKVSYYNQLSQKSELIKPIAVKIETHGLRVNSVLFFLEGEQVSIGANIPTQKGFNIALHNAPIISALTARFYDHKLAKGFQVVYENGKFTYSELVNDMPFGKYATYNTKGQIQEEGQFVQMRESWADTITIFDPFTFEETVQVYHYDFKPKKAGIWRYYDLSGRLVREEEYE